MAQKRPPSSYGAFVARAKAEAARRRRLEARVPDPDRKPPHAPLARYLPDPGVEARSIDWEAQLTEPVARELARRMRGARMQMLVMGTGTGKTAVAVGALGAMAQAGDLPAFMVVAPSAVVEQGGWQQTIASWNAGHPGCQLRPAYLTTHDRFAAAMADPEDRERVRAALGRDGVVVVDEAHAFKNPTGRRAKGLQMLKGARRMCLTATPYTNNALMDTVSYLVMAGAYRSKNDFLVKTGLASYVDSYGNLPMFLKTAGGRSLNGPVWDRFREARDELAPCLFAPDTSCVDPQMPLATDRVWRLPPDEDLDMDMASLEMAYKDRLFSSAKELVDALQERVCISQARLERCCELALAPGCVQPLVFFLHAFARESLLEAFSARGVSCQVLDGSHPVSKIDAASDSPILVQYQAGGAGIEFPRSNTSVFYENQYSYTLLTQAKGRNVRRGCTHEVTRHHIVSPTAFDQQVFEGVQACGELNDRELERLARLSVGEDDLGEG